MTQKYQNSVNFIKIIATFCIAMLHFLMTAGIGRVGRLAIFVDFFFVVSGLLLAASKELKNQSILPYIKERYKKIWPHFFFGFVMYFALLLVRCWPDLKTWGGILSHSILEVFLLQILGIGSFSTNHGAVWYLSVLLLCSFILYFALGTRCKGILVKYLAPIIAVGTMITNQVLFGTEIVEWDSTYSFICNPSFYRGLGGMSAGIWIYHLSKSRKGDIVKFINKRGITCQVVEVLLLVIVIVGALMHFNTLILVELIWVMTFLSWNCKHSLVLSNAAYDYAAIYLLPIYINHALFVDFRLILRLPISFPVQVIGYIFAVTAYSVFSYKFVGKMKLLVEEQIFKWKKK